MEARDSITYADPNSRKGQPNFCCSFYSYCDLHVLIHVSSFLNLREKETLLVR